MTSLFPRSQPPRQFSQGFLKDWVYKDNPQTIERLKENIKREIKRIPADTLELVFDNFNVI